MDTRQYYLVDVDSGSLRFTPRGRRELGRLFRFAGIDLEGVRTQEAYHQGLRQVRQAVQGVASRAFVRPVCGPVGPVLVDDDAEGGSHRI
jgi:hypothetical protein